MEQNREKLVVKTGIIGTAVNVILAIIKIIVGLGANSISIVSDAVNNLSDAVSSVITIIAMKLAARPADKKHPYGFGRIEYLSGSIISAIVLIAGSQFFISSFKRILNPLATDFSGLSILFIIIAIATKLVLGSYTKRMGKKVNSPSLKASGADALYDAIMSSVTLISAIISKFAGISIDGYVGVLIALFIIYSGIQMMKETISSILGERVDKELVQDIKNEILEYKPILGAYDFILHNYGPTSMLGSVNVELPDYLNIKEAYLCLQEVQRVIYQKFGVYLVLGIYSVNTYNSEIAKIEKKVRDIVISYKYVLQIHAFIVDTAKEVLSFDAVFDFDNKDDEKLKKEIEERLRVEYPGYKIIIQVDKDYSTDESDK